MKRIELYQFGDCGPFDDLNPFRWFGEQDVPELLYYIAKETPKIHDIVKFCNKLEGRDLHVLTLIDQLINLNVIRIEQSQYKVNFPVFLNSDIETINQFSLHAAEILSDELMLHKEAISLEIRKLEAAETFDEERLLYHIIGCDLFDGYALDWLTDQTLITTSKIQKGDRDYLLIGFEKSDEMDVFSEQLLCSCNNRRSKTMTFMSFGDGNGDRHDFYRYFRNVVKKLALINPINQAYIDHIEDDQNQLLEDCESVIRQLMKSEAVNKDHLAFKILKQFEYIDENQKICVPIFRAEEQPIIDKLYEEIMKRLETALFKVFDELELIITATKHGVAGTEISNELWHQLFGNVNELLVKRGIFETPKNKKGEGRYLKALYVR